MNSEHTSDGSITLTEREPDDDDAQRRVYRRYAVELDLSLGSTHNFYAGLVENVSVGGVFIATHLCRPVGEQLDITIHLAEGDVPVRGVGEVRWVRALSEAENTPPGMGVRFLQLEPGGREAIERFLSRREPMRFDEA
jgi:uncharacterized protein (TIGR02266 family)